MRNLTRRHLSSCGSLLFAIALIPLGAAPSGAQATAPARPTAPKDADKGLPPLLDRELFFGNPEIAGAQLSPDGQYIAFLKPWKDVRNVWVKKRGETYDKAHLI